MSSDNGQEERRFLIVFNSKGMLVLDQYRETEMYNMFLGAGAEFPVEKKMQRIFNEFIKHALMGEFMVITLMKGTNIVVTRIKGERNKKQAEPEKTAE